ncbi:MAG TPA: multicopper oxidase domain-containing protein [Nevskiaceae bacterium]|nr:multicopper oxidase domain-containing protein [Nevskiaceae bacterium]
MKRRDLLKLGGALAVAAAPVGEALARPPTPSSAASTAPALEVAPGTPADYVLHIAPGTVELSKEVIVSTTLYNGQFPGPLMRFREGHRAVVDIHNDTDSAEQVHWHGQYLPDSVDGAAEERTPYIQPHNKRREVFMPHPTGLRFYHTHVRAGQDLSRGLYAGLAGPVYIEPKHEPGDYDQEVFLTLKEFEPYFTHVDMDPPYLQPAVMEPALIDIAAHADPHAGSMPPGFELAYRSYGINGKALGYGEPLRVKAGQRVMLHVINASATEVRSLALPGHGFKVVALDGYAVPTQAEVPVLWIGTAERVSAIVEMQHPGVWVLGDLDDEARNGGMGVVVEYAGARGKPAWQKPAAFKWDYRRFAAPQRRVATPDDTFNMLFTGRMSAVDGKFNEWFVNGVAYDHHTMPVTRHLRLGRRYRLRFGNASNDAHPLHLHRHGFEITRIGGQPTSGVIKDVVMIAPFQTVEVDFTANQPGLTLFHCHMQIHMDFGFMALFQTT